MEQTAIAAKQLKAEVESLRKLEAKRSKEIEKLEARRALVEASVREHAEHEAKLMVELEALRAQVESNEQGWPEKELSIKSEIEALRKAESIQAQAGAKGGSSTAGRKRSAAKNSLN